MVRKEVLQFCARSTEAEKTAKSISERKAKEVRRAILAKDVEWQVWLEELAEQVVKLSKAGYLDTGTIAELKTRITSSFLTELLVRAKVADVPPPA
jgi:hypothetical protein